MPEGMEEYLVVREGWHLEKSIHKLSCNEGCTKTIALQFAMALRESIHKWLAKTILC